MSLLPIDAIDGVISAAGLAPIAVVSGVGCGAGAGDDTGHVLIDGDLGFTDFKGWHLYWMDGFFVGVSDIIGGAHDEAAARNPDPLNVDGLGLAEDGTRWGEDESENDKLENALHCMVPIEDKELVITTTMGRQHRNGRPRLVLEACAVLVPDPGPGPGSVPDPDPAPSTCLQLQL